MTLRDYQQGGHDAAMRHLRRSLLPCLIAHATGAGKSHLIAALASTLHNLSHGKRVLCLAPSKELVLQNTAKYIATGNPASIFSASAGSKCLEHPVVFGSPVSVLNSIDRFTGQLVAVICDEAHGLTPTIRKIIDRLKELNPNLRVIGLTATPYRMGTGYIYRTGADGVALGDDLATDPYYQTCVHEVGARELIARGYLTPPRIGTIGEHYDTSALQLNSRHQFDADDIDAAFHGHGRLTSRIIADVVQQSQERRGVIIYASTIAHAEECLASLPPNLSAIVTGKTKAKDRTEVNRRFLARELKYLVNVGIYTTGFDAPHVDVIALLRATESAGLLQQIVGRGLRKYEGQDDCLILDYAENLRRHCPGGDIFDPIIEARESKKSGKARVECPECGTVNLFSARQLEKDQSPSQHGYALRTSKDGKTVPVMSEFGPLPSHYGRRCFGETETGRCTYRWTSKQCPACDQPNDVTARRCEHCKDEIIDPNEKLRLDAIAADKARRARRTERVLAVDEYEFFARSGHWCIRVTYQTEAQVVPIIYFTGSSVPWQAQQYREYKSAKAAGIRTLTYRQSKSGFYNAIAFNEEKT